MSGIRVALLGGYVAGILASSHAFVIGARWMAVLLAVAGLVTARALSWSEADVGRKDSLVLVAFLCGSALLAGAWAGGRAWAASLEAPLREHVRTLTARAPDTPVVIEGRVASDATRVEYGVSLSLQVDRIRSSGNWMRTKGRVALTVGGAHQDRRWHTWRKGRRLRVVAGLRGPPFYQNPGGSPREFTAVRRDATWLGSVKSEHLVEDLARGSWLDEMFGAVRERTRRAIGPLVPEPTIAAILIAILIGDRGAIPHDVEVRLQKAGTYHVIAISGGNIAIFVGLLSIGARLLRAPTRWRVAVTVVLVTAYGLLAGGAASVSRACLAAVIYLAGSWCDVRARGLPVLWAAVVTLLAFSPLSVFDTGFQLTAAATAAVLLTGAMEPAGLGTGRRGYVYTLGRSTVLATLAADVAMLPTVLSSFNRVTIAGVFLNFAALPLMSLAQIAGFGAVCAEGVWEGGRRAAALVASLAIQGLLWSARLVDAAPWLTWRVPAPSLWASAVYWICWIAWTLLQRRNRFGSQNREVPRRRGLAIAQRSVFAAACLWTWGLMIGADALVSRVARPPEPAAESTRKGILGFVFLDVGQGDATVIRLPSGRTWLVDAGGFPGAASFDIGDRVVAPALWALGTRRLDVLALTHPDPDHAGGAPAIAADFKPRALWEGISVFGHPLNERIHNAIPPARRVAMRRGRRIEVDGVTVCVWHPPPPSWTRIKVRNDDSLVLEFTLGDVRIILPGDIGAEVERELAPRLTPRAGMLTVLKLPHHGSAGSSSADFLDALHPTLAVVSS
ncbi:MAG: ComEC/Rec2 family competence protein, partial [Vicinamibacterales bacterium]